MNRIERSKSFQKRSCVELDRIYSFEETSGILHVSAPTLRGLLKSGKINGKKLGRRWFISGNAINTALDLGLENPLNSMRPMN